MEKNYVSTSAYGLIFTKQFFQDCLRKQFKNPKLTVHLADYAHSGSEEMMLELKHPKNESFPIGVHKYNLSWEADGLTQETSVIVKSNYRCF